MERPTGITILAVLAAIGGVLGLFAALALLGIGATAAPSGAGGLVLVVGLIALAYALLSLALAYGFWTLQPWAWPLGIGVQVLGILQALGRFANDQSNIVALAINLAIAGFILWYLFQPHVKAAFGRT
ncbi:MAG TPA: DUF2127 domain-containing protein [candidate division Zixibacteria bacterium]|nr:DUF2127 domain-containing protein [candidate division Zixibacteria bacterium]